MIVVQHVLLAAPPPLCLPLTACSGLHGRRHTVRPRPGRRTFGVKSRGAGASAAILKAAHPSELFVTVFSSCAFLRATPPQSGGYESIR